MIINIILILTRKWNERKMIWKPLELKKTLILNFNLKICNRIEFRHKIWARRWAEKNKVVKKISLFNYIVFELNPTNNNWLDKKKSSIYKFITISKFYKNHWKIESIFDKFGSIAKINRVKFQRDWIKCFKLNKDIAENIHI